MEYVDNAADPKIKFLVTHRDEAGEEREAVRQIIGVIYEADLSNRLSGEITGTPAEVTALRDEMNRLGLNEAGKNDAAFSLLEAQATGDKSRYVEACEQHFRQMTDAQQQNVLFAYDILLTGASPEVLQRAIKFVRTLLPDLPAETIYFASISLMKLEKK